MKYVDIYSVRKMDNYISQDKVNAIQLYYKADLERLLCCNKVIGDGCQIILWNGDTVEICHDCFIDLFDEVLTITHQDITKNKQYYTVNLPDYSFCISNSSFMILRAKLNLYFKDLYKRHIRDDLFLESESFCIQKFLDKTRRVVKESQKESKQTLRMSAGKRKRFFNERNIISDISQCYKFEFDISIPKDEKRIVPLFDLEVYTTFSNISCKTGFHSNYQDAVIVISDGRDYGFTFSFCADHLYDFAVLLEEFYFNPDIDETENGDFRLETGYFGEPCFLTRHKHRIMYKLHINKCSVVLAKEGLFILAEKVLTSAAFSELYPIEAKQFATLSKHKKVKETESLRECLAKEQQAKKDEIKSLTAYYKNVIHDNTEKIEELKTVNRELIEERDNLKYKLNHIDKIILQQKNIAKMKCANRIINCLDCSKTNITLGITKKAAKKYKNPGFAVTYVNGIKCATFPHYVKCDSIALMETHRANDAFCFAVCRDCADIFLKGLREAKPDRPYVNEKMRFTAAVVSALSNTHCYLCGCEAQTEYIIKIGNVKFVLCSDCEKKLETALEDIQRKLNHIHLLGGKKFIEEIKNF